MSSSLSAADAPGRPSSPARSTPVTRWPSETPLFVACLCVSIVLWLLLTVSMVGLAYAALLGGFFFMAHVMFVAHVRGSGVRVGPDQLPDLHARVHTIAGRIGLERVPEVYLMQAGGALNAFATRFLGRHIVVLFSDLLDACGDSQGAADMIIAHELGHVKAGHLRWHWFLLPANLIPFLGMALSRAREYTCDRFGMAGSADRDGALLGLTILAAGGSHARLVNRDALVRQRADLNTGWMRIGEWLSSHPPLARRLAALEPSLGGAYRGSLAGTIRALLIFATGVVIVGALAWAVAGIANLVQAMAT